VNELVGEPALALLTNFRLRNSSSLDVLVFFSVASGTSEAGLLHLWNCVRCPDHYTLKCNQFVYVLGVQLSDLVRFQHVEWAHLDDLFALLHFLEVTSLHASVHHVLAVALLFVHTKCDEVKDWYYVCRVVLQLLV